MTLSKDSSALVDIFNIFDIIQRLFICAITEHLACLMLRGRACPAALAVVVEENLSQIQA